MGVGGERGRHREEDRVTSGMQSMRGIGGGGGELSLAGAATSIIFVATNTSFVPTKVCLSRQKYFSRQTKHNFAATNVLSQQAYFCCDKRRVFSRQKTRETRVCRRVCRDKNVLVATKLSFLRQIFISTKMILMAALANDTRRDWGWGGGRDE